MSTLRVEGVRGGYSSAEEIVKGTRLRRRVTGW